MEPAAGSRDSSAELLLDVDDADTCYVVRFRELTGVRYLALLRREGGVTSTLVEAVQGFSFDVTLEVDVAVDGLRLEVCLDGEVVAQASDVRRLRGHAVGLAVSGTAMNVHNLRVTALNDNPLPRPPRRLCPTPVPSSAIQQPGPSIMNRHYRIDFPTASWPEGHEITPQVSAMAPDGSWVSRTAGDWYMLSGDYGSRADLHASMSSTRVSFRTIECQDEHTALLTADVEGYRDVAVTWSLRETHPRLTVRIVPEFGGHHVMIYHAFDGLDLDDVREVLCGPLQHARMVRGPELLGAIELTAPLALVECRQGGDPWTWGIVVPGQDIEFIDEENRDGDDQPYGMSLRGPDGKVQPTIALPQYGRRARLEAGQPSTSTVGLYARPVALFDAYRQLLREEYGYQAYRRNIFGQSLTDTMYNLIDLLATDPHADDSVDYQASPSGWWRRAKGFIDIENDQTVRTTTTAVLLSAAYLTDDMDLYDRRALPLVEYHLSRNGYGWTPRKGFSVYSDATKSELCATPFGVSALGALHAMTRRRNPGIARLALTDVGSGDDFWLQRAPMSAPLAAYRLTADTEHLATARASADAYIADQIDSAYTENVNPHDFGIYYSRDWIGLLELYEETAEERYLKAAYREASRFVTQVFVRPVHDGVSTVPDRPVYHDRQIELSRWWNPEELFDYPVTDISPEPAESWVLSVTGLTFEALQTYRYSGPSLNPAWAAHLLRLAHLVDDPLLRDVAHNAVIGRYTNYPGYYLRQHTVAPLKPDFPFTGPFDNTTIYYHHAPAQLGMTIDYLLTEHETRSAGAIRFPSEFEENFVWFRFRTYGHRPGCFYGDDDVWLWMPRGVISLDNSQINWISGESGQRFYLSLTNSMPGTETVNVQFGDVLGLPADGTRKVTIIEAGIRRQETMSGSSLAVDVPGHGLTAVILDQVGPFDVPMHRTTPSAADDLASYHFADQTPVGSVWAILLERPDGSGNDAYVQSRCATPAVLHYSLDDGKTWCRQTKTATPAEWTVRMGGSGTTFRYRVACGSATTDEAELRRAGC